MLKRLFDIVVAGFILTISFPILFILAILIRVKLGAPVFFLQIRSGLNGKSFKIFKFRTMLDVANVDGNSLSDESRLTHFGKILRATSLDELPELWNVFVGDMSLVGPRPLLMEYLLLYNNQNK